MNSQQSIHRALSALESLFGALASICLFAIMVIVFFDVGLRYLFNSPLSWSYDLISLYLMVALFFLALSVTQRDDHHVRVDIIFRYVSPRTRHVMDLVGYLLTAVILLAVVYQGGLKAWGSWQNHEVMAGAVQWPTWLSAILVPLGMGLLALRLVFSVCSLATAIVRGSDSAIGVNQHALGDTEL